LKQNNKGKFVFQPVVDRYPDKELPIPTPLPTDSLGRYVVSVSEDDILSAKTLPTEEVNNFKIDKNCFIIFRQN
jgi:hypothetical protein